MLRGVVQMSRCREVFEHWYEGFIYSFSDTMRYNKKRLNRSLENFRYLVIIYIVLLFSFLRFGNIYEIFYLI